MITTKNPVNDELYVVMFIRLCEMREAGRSVEEALAETERVCARANREFEGENGGVTVVEEVYGGKWNGGRFVFSATPTGTAAALTPYTLSSVADTANATPESTIDVAKVTTVESVAVPSVADDQPQSASQGSQQPHSHSHSRRSTKTSKKKKK